MGCCNRRCGLIAGAVFGALVAILGGILIPVGNSIVEETVNKEAVIENGTTAYDNWVSVGAPMYREFYFFDVQNPEEIVNGSVPVVKEKGPYTYRVRYLPKDNIEPHPNHTVSYRLPLGAIFEPSRSVGSEDDIVTTLNLFLVGGLSTLEGMAWLPGLNKAPLFQRRTVKKLLWGYRSGSDVEIGLFSPYNGTYDGNYTIFTGKDDISKVGMIYKYKGERSLSFWNNTYCDMINGTDASSFTPFVDKTKPLYFFSSDICRSVSADYTESLDLLGIEVYRFSLMPKILAAPVENPENYCFCKDEKVYRNYTLGGVMDISPCEGRPVYISLPHFLHGSASLREDVQGLNPIEAKHSTFLDVEPTTGFTLRFAKRLQVNMMYKSSKKIPALNKVRDYTIFPILWVNEMASMDDETAEMLKKELFSRIEILDIVQKVLLGVGVSVFALCLIGYCVVRRRDSQSKIA
ncbi:platelet glycoprotein 4 [Chaetodon trifascialis]|uniref:platelet glycoprotein 4 n=1 Tax=Chaetodon trifascialis TaxID=109706 RepID=UPI0039939A70